MADKIKHTIVNQSGKEVGSLELEPSMFAAAINKTAVHDVVRQQRAGQRAGTANTLRRSDMEGGAKKPWKQKHTGRARAGSSISPLWVGGAIVFGPKPRSYEFSLNKNVKFAGLASALTDKVNNKNFVILDTIAIKSPKAAEAKKILDNLQIKDSVLVVLDRADVDFEAKAKSFRNLDKVSVLTAEVVNVYEVMSHNKVLCSQDGLAALTRRCQGEKKVEAVEAKN